MLELVPQSVLTETIAAARDQCVQLIQCERDRREHADVRLGRLVEERALRGAGFHHQRECGKRSRAWVDLGAVEIVGEDHALRHLGTEVTSAALINSALDPSCPVKSEEPGTLVP